MRIGTTCSIPTLQKDVISADRAGLNRHIYIDPPTHPKTTIYISEVASYMNEMLIPLLKGGMFLH